MENATNVITGFRFILMPRAPNDRQKAESPVGVASREPGAGLGGGRRSLARRVGVRPQAWA